MVTYAISDVHGHLTDLRDVLGDAGLVGPQDRWTGGDDQLWVLGDLVDRGPDGIGVIRLVRSLQQQAPDQVHVLMGNHEALMLGERLFPGGRFAGVWLTNGGRRSDQEQLSDDEVSWLRALPAVARSGDWLMMHSDTTAYLDWGSTIQQVNSTVAAVAGGDDAEQHFELFAELTDRFAYLGQDGPEVARAVLAALGGERIVHGHSIIGSLVDRPSSQVEGPLPYADGLVLAIDGGRYDGGPLLLVALD